MRLWIDDVRPAPEGYIWVKSVNEAKEAIKCYIGGHNKKDGRKYKNAGSDN